MKILKIFSFKKVLSVTITVSLLLTVVSPGVFASNNIDQSSVFDKSSIINSKYGEITDSADTGSNITVINIQDLHCHLQTQQNINNILKEIDNKISIDTIFVEGGYDNINFDLIDNIKDKKFKAKIIDNMLKNGVLTGAEYYALINNKENILKGIDDEKLHKENISRLSQIINNKEKYLENLKNISEEIKILNNKYLNKKNIKFSKIIDNYKKGKLSARKFYKILLKYAKESNSKQTFENVLPLFVADYPNISNYLNMSDTYSDINYQKLSTQLQNFLVMLKKDLQYGQYKQLISDTDNFSDVSVLADFITKFCEQKNINLCNNYDELNKFVKNIKLKQKINPTELLKEEEKLINAVRLSLSESNTEYEISYIADFFNYFKRYLNYELTAYQWQYFEENFDTFKSLYSKYSVIDRLKNIEADFNLINTYYSINEKRNFIFLEKITNNVPSIINNVQSKDINGRDTKKIIENSAKVIVVVAGGFHSQELKDELTAKQINYITIMPKITTEIDTAKTEYEDYVKTQDKMLSQALALRIAASAPTAQQQELIVKSAFELLPEVTAENIKYLEQILNIKIEKLNETEYKIHFDNNSEITIDTEDIPFDEQKQIDNIKYNISAIFKTTLRIIPNEGFKSIFSPDIYSLVKNISLALFKFNIYFSDGIIPEIINTKLTDTDIDGISIEAYSTFLPEVQRLLFERYGYKSGLREEVIDKDTDTETTNDEYGRLNKIADKIREIFQRRESPYDFSDEEKVIETKPKKRFVQFHSKLNKSLKMKIPQEIVDALQLNDGEKFYITRLKNNLLVISKRGEQLQELVNIFMNSMGDTGLKSKFKATHYVYPNTYDFILGKDNTVSTKILYRPEILRTPLTQKDMDDIILMYDSNEKDILGEESDETQVKEKRNINEQEEDDYEQTVTSEYRSKIKTGLFTPSINNNILIYIYRFCVETAYKILASTNILRKLNGSQKYLDIIRNRKNGRYLFSVVRKKSVAIEYKLMAFMYIKILGYPFSATEAIEDSLKAQFIEYLQYHMRKRDIFIRNNFDLRAVATGIFLLEDYFVKRDKDKQKIYEKISKSVFVKSGNKGIANAGMFFVSAHPLTIAHEIGHNILYTYDFYSEANKEKTTIHELFADVFANCFGFEVGIEKNTTGNILYGLFDDASDNKIFQDEHRASRGFINLLKSRSETILQKDVYWQELAETVMQYVEEESYMKNRSSLKKQKEILEDLFSRYFELLYKKRQITRSDGMKIDKFFSNNKSAFSLIKDLFDEIKNYNFRDYIDILNALREEIPVPMSYWKSNRDKRKSSFTRWTTRSSQKEIDEFISSVILAQPEKKEQILDIIKDKLLSKQTFNYRIMASLFFIDTLNNTDTLLTEKDVSSAMDKIVAIFPKQNTFTAEDYYNISDYIYLLQSSVVGDILDYIKINYPEKYYIIFDKIKKNVNFSLSRYYDNRDNSLYRKALDIINIIKTEMENQSGFTTEEIVSLFVIELLSNYTQDFLFDKDYLEDVIFDIVDRTGIANKPFYEKNEYLNLLSYCKFNHLLSADYRIKILNFIGIKDFNKQQEIISALEYPQILFGIFFPKIREGFKKQHSTDIEERLSVLEQDTAGKIKEVFNLSVEEVKELSFFNKIVTVAKILTNRTIRVFNRTQHLLLNGVSKEYIGKSKKIDVIYREMEYVNEYIEHENLPQNQYMEIFIAVNTKDFKSRDLINTGLKVNGQTIWQVKNKDKKLIFVANNVNIKDIAETLNGYKKLNNKIRRISQTKKNIDLHINSFILIRGEFSPLEDKNAAKSEDRIDTGRLQATADTRGYIEMLAAA